MSGQKVLLVNGSPHEKGCTHTVLTEIAAVLRAEGMSAGLFWIGAKPIQSCIDCGRCGEKGRCVFEDRATSWRLLGIMTDLSSVPRFTMPEPLAH